jgi:hypothetical protein
MRRLSVHYDRGAKLMVEYCDEGVAPDERPATHASGLSHDDSRPSTADTAELKQRWALSCALHFRATHHRLLVLALEELQAARRGLPGLRCVGEAKMSAAESNRWRRVEPLQVLVSHSAACAEDAAAVRGSLLDVDPSLVVLTSAMLPRRKDGPGEPYAQARRREAGAGAAPGPPLPWEARVCVVLLDASFAADERLKRELAHAHLSGARVIPLLMPDYQFPFSAPEDDSDEGEEGAPAQAAPPRATAALGGPPDTARWWPPALAVLEAHAPFHDWRLLAERTEAQRAQVAWDALAAAGRAQGDSIEAWPRPVPPRPALRGQRRCAARLTAGEGRVRPRR